MAIPSLEAVDAAKHCKKRKYTSIARRWRDDASYRDTQQKHGWSLALNTGAVVIVIVNDMVEFATVGRTSTVARMATRRMEISNGGRSRKYSRSEPLPLVQESCTFEIMCREMFTSWSWKLQTFPDPASAVYALVLEANKKELDYKKFSSVE